MEDFPAGPPAIAGDRTPGRSLMPRAAEPVSHNEGHTLSLQLEGALTQQRRPNTAKKKQFINLKNFIGKGTGMAKTNLEKSKVEGPMPQKAPGECGSVEEINT